MSQIQSVRQEQGNDGESLEMYLKKGEALHSQAVYDAFASLFAKLFHTGHSQRGGRRVQSPMRERISH